ncbi:MAG: hypothetical protein ABW024_09350 [Microbacterium sp.]
MTGWWRRNAAALVTAGVLIPVTIAAIALHERNDTGGSWQDSVVATGESLDYAGATVGPATAEFVDDDAAPSGTRVVRVTVDIDPDPSAPIACLTPQLRETEGRQREWDERSYELGRGFDEDLTSCASDRSTPYSMLLEYVVPDDAEGPFTVDVDAAAGWPVLARLRVQP